MKTNWTISYTDFFGKKKVEAFTDKDEAQARYESLLPRTYGDFGDLASVTAPIRSATKISESILDDVDLSNQWDDLNAVIKGLFIRGFDNPSGKYFYVKSDYRKDEDACHSVYSKGTDSHLLDIHVVGAEPIVAAVNQGLQDEPFDMVYDAIELIVKDWFNMVADGFHGVIAKIDDPSEYAVWKKSKGFKNEDGASASSLGVVPTGVVGRKGEAKKNEADGADLASVYGSGDIVTHENSADGFYVDDHDPMGWAILNNDVATMKELFAGNATTPDKPWLYAGWVEDTDAPEDKEGNYPYVYNWDSERDLNFVEDWKRVVGETDNEEALNLLLEHDPDFIPTAIDFYNAFLAGYDKKLLRKLLDNIRAVWDKDDINDSYLNYEDFGETPYENLIEFLGE